jgi:CMP-N,N'-diacetyllegionaminic acid synthase
LKYLLIIPARGGSKGIINKNIIKINDKPLIEYTIASALAAQKKLNDCKVIVSTDSDTIKKLSLKNGASVPFLRDKSISEDMSKSSEYVNHAIKYFEDIGEMLENIIILQPTSPLRTNKDIIAAINLFENNNGETLISAYKENYLNEKGTYKMEGIYGAPNNIFHSSGGRRQEDDDIVVRNGAIYIFKVPFFKKENQVISDKPLIYLMKKSQSINIDTYEDLFIAEKLLKILLDETK